MWSGPRNVSSALMRSFGSREDCVVVDEPFYAHYLKVTGLAHPAREATLASQPTDWRAVAKRLTAEPLPEGKSLHYQKHMAHHLLDGMAGAWMDELVHAFLIREPAAMLASLIQVWPEPTLADTGLPQQVSLFEHLCETKGFVPPVVDSADLLENPEGLLRRLCAEVGIRFDPAMLAWEPGPRPTDGVWAPHWYAQLERSTGFAPQSTTRRELPPEHQGLLQEAEALYRRLHDQRLRA
jgi:hypothetical protein